MATLLRNGTHPNGAATVDPSVDRWSNTLCPYCGVGCGLRVGVKQGRVTKIKGDPDHPSTAGDLCLKPLHLATALYADDRARHPLLRYDRDATLERVSWDRALQHVATTFLRIRQEHGPAAIAFYGSGQCTTEDYYVANKLMKGFIGANNFDANSRLCMASAVTGYVTSLGSDGPPPAYADIDLADCFFIIGANMADCHPVLFNRIKRRKQSAPDKVKVIVVDPRRTRTVDIADLHLAIRPGCDVTLLNGLLHLLLKHNLIDPGFIANHTNGFAEMASTVAAYTPDLVAQVCGIGEEELTQAALAFGRAQAALSFWSMGLNQSIVGVQKNNGVINLHLATGQIGRPGSGPFSLTGQPNAMGGREVGGLGHLLPGYRAITNPDHRTEVERFWGVPAGRIAPQSGRAAVEMFEAAARGEIKAMWIMCTNPMVSMPNLDVIEAALHKLDLLVVSDAYHPTDTSQYAHVLFPAAQWSEREGVMTNSERRITYLPKLAEPVGEALPDWQIITKVACAMGFTADFNYPNTESIFDEFKRLTEGRPCDYSGVSYGRLQTEGPLQWPLPASDHPGTARLYTGLHGTGAGVNTPDGRAKFVPIRHQIIAEAPDDDYPLVLTTGRVKNQWHTMTRTGKSPSLLKETAELFLEIHPRDAERRRIEMGDLVEVRSRRGAVWAKAIITPKIRRGVCFLPFHWGRMAGFYKAANNVTLSAYDPVSKEPELKACAVQVSLVPGYKQLAATKIYQRIVQIFDSEAVAQLEPMGE